MNAVNEIRTFNLPNIFPSGYQEILYTKDRITHNGGLYEEFRTQKKFKIVDNPNYYDNIKIQSIIWNKYEIRLFVREQFNEELLKAGEYIQVTLMDGTVHNGIIINITAQSDVSNHRFLIIEYYDSNLSNYQIQSFSNFLESSYLSEQISDGVYAVTQMPYVVIRKNLTSTTREENKYYTKLIPVFNSTDYDYIEEKVSGRDVISKEYYQEKVDLIFYMTDITKEGFKEKLFDSDSWAYYYGGVIKVAIDKPKVTIQEVEGAINLYKIDMSIIFENNINNPFDRIVYNP